MNNFLSITTLNVNGLNAPIKRHRTAEWIRKHDPHICCLYETHLRTKDLHRLKVKGWKQIFQANDRGKKARIAILTSEKMLAMISILLNLLRLALCPIMWSIFEKVPWTLEKNVYFASLG